MSAHIKRGTNISERIPVQCGTKQGGLTSPFTTIPRWYINGVSLDIEDKLTYLGSILGENGDKEHCENHCVINKKNFLLLFGIRNKNTMKAELIFDD